MNETRLLFWRLDLAYFREKKDLSFDELAGLVNGDPSTRPAKQINQIIQLRTQNIKTVYTNRL